MENMLESRILKTTALYLTFAGLGFCAPILGLSIVHMEYILNSNTHILAFAFTTHSIGYTIGGIICGLVYDHANKEFLFSLCVMTEATMIIVSGFCGHVVAFLASMSLVGVAMGFIDTAGQSYCVNLWANHRFKEPILQAVHAVWSLAATIGPFVIRPFLVELHSKTSIGNASSNCSGNSDVCSEPEDRYNSSSVTDMDLSSVVNNEFQPTEQMAGIDLARYAYLTIGLITFISGILFYIIYFYYCNPVILRTTPKEHNKHLSMKTKSIRQRERLLLLAFLFMLFMFYFLYIYIEGIPIAYFTAFVIKHLNWSVHHSTLVMAVFYGMHCLGRIIGIPLSIVLRPGTMVIMNLVLTSIAYFLLLFVHTFDWIIWISAILSGYGMSSTFAAMVLWVSEIVPLTGRVAAVLLVGGSFGGMTGPLLVGQLFEAVSPMWMVYILCVASMLHIALFALLFIFVGKQKQILSKNFSSKRHEEIHLNDMSNQDI